MRIVSAPPGFKLIDHENPTDGKKYVCSDELFLGSIVAIETEANIRKVTFEDIKNKARIGAVVPDNGKYAKANEPVTVIFEDTVMNVQT